MKQDLNKVRLISYLKKEVKVGIAKIAIVMGAVVTVIGVIFLFLSKIVNPVYVLGVPFNLKGGAYVAIFFGVLYIVLGGVIWLVPKK